MDTKVEPPPDFFGHEGRSFLTFGRVLLSNSYVQVNSFKNDEVWRFSQKTDRHCFNIRPKNLSTTFAG